MHIVDVYWRVWLIGLIVCFGMAFKTMITVMPDKSPALMFLYGLLGLIFGALFGVSMLIKIISYATHGA